jgi:sortase A
MEVRTEAPAPAAGTPTPAQGDRWRRPVRWFGVACLFGASFFGGYVAWLMWGTGVETARAQDELRTETQAWTDGAGQPVPEPDDPTVVVPGDAYAVIQIPSVGIDFVVVQGTGYADLKLGPGHYPDTADPWDGTGRVGIAGHRTTYQAPFNDLGEVRGGDTITLLTEFGRYDYEVTRTSVIPSEGSGVVLEQTKQPTLVLTTCHPKYSSSQRLIVEADLVSGPA